MTAPGASRGRDGFTVGPDQLIARAGAVDGLADRLHRAATGPLLLNAEAFGLLGGPIFGSTATQATASGTTSVDNLGLIVSAVADKLRDCREAYAETERSATERFVRIEAHRRMWSS